MRQGPQVCQARRRSPSPNWQAGWLKQHDRLMQAASGMSGRIPLVVSGDLHAIARRTDDARGIGGPQQESGQRGFVGAARLRETSDGRLLSAASARCLPFISI